MSNVVITVLSIAWLLLLLRSVDLQAISLEITHGLVIYLIMALFLFQTKIIRLMACKKLAFYQTIIFFMGGTYNPLQIQQYLKT